MSRKELPLSLKGILEKGEMPNRHDPFTLDKFFRFELDGRFEFCPPGHRCALMGMLLKGDEAFDPCDKCIHKYLDGFEVSANERQILYRHFSPTAKDEKT